MSWEDNNNFEALERIYDRSAIFRVYCIHAKQPAPEGAGILLAHLDNVLIGREVGRFLLHPDHIAVVGRAREYAANLLRFKSRKRHPGKEIDIEWATTEVFIGQLVFSILAIGCELRTEDVSSFKLVASYVWRVFHQYDILDLAYSREEQEEAIMYMIGTGFEIKDPFFKFIEGLDSLDTLDDIES